LRGTRNRILYYSVILQWGSLAALLGYPIWFRGGTRSGFQPAILWLSLAFLCACLLNIALRSFGGTEKHSPSRPAPEREPRPIWGLFRDPALWLALAFVGLAGIQRFNAGRQLLYDFAANTWIYEEARYPSLPWAITKEGANEAFFVILPGLIVALMLRHVRLSKRTVLRILRIFVINAGLVALFGIVQYFTHTKSIYWAIPLETYFFASFGYPNHAGSFFLLSFCLCLGLIFHEIGGKGIGTLHSSRSRALCLAATLTFLGAHFSFCRAAIILSWLTLIITITWCFKVPLRHASAATRVQSAFVALAMTTVLAAGLAVFAGDRLHKEFAVLRNEAYMHKQVESRRWLIKPALNMVADYPTFGTGYLGYRSLVPLYLPPDKLDYLKIFGRANVHNDTLETLVEFGAVGFLILLLFTAILFKPALRKAMVEDPPTFFACLALLTTLIHSQIDLPFRSPAIVLSWALVLSALRPLSRSSR
jgi:hypothetical protein